MRPKRTHDVTPNDNLDRAAFLLAFLFGAVGSLLLKALGAHPFIPAGFAAFILGLYAFVAWAGGRVKIEPETIGDNCYYLGFLFTLASLAYTLYQVADPSLNVGRPVNITEVISGFGLALSSTIFGVFLRVWMMQLRPDFVAKDREVRAEINRSFGDFKKNMSGMLSQSKAYATESIQVAAERDARIRGSTEQFLEDHRKSLEKNADALSAHMKEAFSEAALAAAKQITAGINEIQKDQQDQIKEAINELQAIRNRIRELEADTVRDIQARRRDCAAELDETRKLLNDQRAAKDREVRAEINQAFGDFKNAMSGMLSQMKAYAAESVQVAAERDARIRGSTEQFLEDHRKSLAENANNLSNHMKEAFSEAGQKSVAHIMATVAKSQKDQQDQLTLAINELQALRICLQEQEAGPIGDIRVLENNRKSLEENAEFLSLRITEAFSKAARQAANDFSLALCETLKAQQVELKGEFHEGLRSHMENASETDQQVTAKSGDSGNFLVSSVAGAIQRRQQVNAELDGTSAALKETTENNIADHLADESEDDSDAFKQMPWTS